MAQVSPLPGERATGKWQNKKEMSQVVWKSASGQAKLQNDALINGAGEQGILSFQEQAFDLQSQLWKRRRFLQAGNESEEER